MDPAKYNGASLLGLRGIVIKSHGSADKRAFGHALERALDEVRNDVPSRIAHRVAELAPKVAALAP
jgi:glycerol-3-phosphate acyltransferase PlsX